MESSRRENGWGHQLLKNNLVVSSLCFLFPSISQTVCWRSQNLVILQTKKKAPSKAVLFSQRTRNGTTQESRKHLENNSSLGTSTTEKTVAQSPPCQQKFNVQPRLPPSSSCNRSPTFTQPG